jgi:hypothetical protein
VEHHKAHLLHIQEEVCLVLVAIEKFIVDKLVLQIAQSLLQKLLFWLVEVFPLLDQELVVQILLEFIAPL